MANEARIRANFVGGLVEDNPLASGGTTLTSAGLAALGAVTSAEHIAIVLDPDGRAGNPEVIWVTLHTAAATSATVVRGREGTTARAHERDTPWVHGPTKYDVARLYYSSPTDGVTRTSTTMGALSTPWQLTVKDVLVGQIVELDLMCSMLLSADTMLYAGIARNSDSSLLQRGSGYNAAASTRSGFARISCIDEVPVAGDNVYDVYVASNSGTVTVQHGTLGLSTGATTPWTLKGRSFLTGAVRFKDA